jgi:hypothetical protein
MSIEQTILKGFAKGRNRSSLLKSFALLFLVAHAFIVNTTHFHKPAPPCDLSYLSGPQISEQGSCSDNRHTASDTDCPSCVLQRNFVSDVRIPCLVIDLALESIAREAIFLEPRLCGTYLVPSSRAPPLA